MNWIKKAEDAEKRIRGYIRVTPLQFIEESGGESFKFSPDGKYISLSEYEVFKELSQRWQQYQKSYHDLLDTDMKEFNRMLSENGILAINAMKLSWGAEDSKK